MNFVLAVMIRIKPENVERFREAVPANARESRERHALQRALR